MNDEQMKIMFREIKNVYPGFTKNSGHVNRSVIDTWTALFADDDFELVMAAVKAFMVSDTRGFAPSPGQIKEKMRLIMSPSQMTEQEAWTLVYKAIRKSGYLENATKAHESLPEVIRSVVNPSQLREWAMAPIDSVQTVIASNFMRAYRDRREQVAEFNKLPGEVKRAITGAMQERLNA